ncbi:type II secretion system protein GspD [Acetohalobium arabaticum]|uniref:Type II and III secretion system protein n=1 Tax=Acetohalobium arabaticum (strain ATCC 49924 / DSM 5501 / Z-7288) TaxID=574087 RepID=D9QRX3_ACEAZ|nr:secretin N-terminal domain-containing protein [Acetohalobium arabaticum]ADL13264.1 type II and III secretion system protein [Acetohalobium arabaticum DSM 5501]
MNLRYNNPSKVAIIIYLILVIVLLSSAAVAEKMPESDQQIDLNLRDVDLKDAFRALADVSGVNIIADSSVEGKVTVKLKDVSFLKAMNLITKTNSLSYRVLDGVVIVGSSEKLKSNFEKKKTKIFKLENSDPEKVKENLSLLIKNKAIGINERTKSLIVTAYPNKLKEIGNIIEQLDHLQKQVIIEARIEDVSYDKLKDLGINWSFAKNRGDNKGEQISDTDIENGGSGILEIGDVSMNYTAIIRALKSTDDSTTLANPRIATIDGKEAVINMGQEVPILKSEKDDDGQTSTNISFRDVGTVLKITPRINNNQIRMNIKPEVSEVDHWEGSYPVINTKKVETNIIVKNGETIVIGGLISEKEINQLSKVPLFGDVPIFGELFKSRRTTKEKRELVIFITPRIIEDNGQADEEEKDFSASIHSKDKKDQ